MSPSAKDILGAWRLESWSFVCDDGRPVEYPLGPDAKGIILYTVDGHVSATIMRASGAVESFAYAGRFDVRDGTVFHSIEVATNPALVGITSTRYAALEGDRLTLSGPDFAADTGRTQRIVWRRNR